MKGAASMDSFHHEQRECIERFVRHENIARFGRMLATERNESERRILAELIAQERGEQRNTGDLDKRVAFVSIFP
jgi:hypothetical protein